MATAIPIYKRQVIPGGVQSNPGASSAVESQSYMGQALSNAGASIGNFATKMQAQQQQVIENRSAVDVGNVLSKGDIYWQEESVKRFQGWKVGQPNIGDALSEDFDKWQKQSAAELQTEKARTYFLEHTARQKAVLMTNAFAWQQKATTAKLNADTVIGQKDDEYNVSKDPSRLEDVYARRMETVLARSDMTEAEKITYGSKYKESLRVASETGEMNRDPRGWYERRFGKLPQEGRGAVPAMPQGGAGSSSLKGDASLPAGLRNDNPFNIKYAGQRDSTGPSQNTDQGDPQAVYQDIETGVAAGYKLALKKYGAGKTTANQLIAAQGGWTPGNTDAAANVAKSMGLGPDDDLRLRDAGQLEKFGRALIKQEQGTANSKVSDDTLKSVAASVMSGAPVQVAKADTGTMTDAGGTIATVDQPASFTGLDWERQLQLKSQAETKIRQGQALAQSSIEQTVRDQATQALTTGNVGTPLTEGQFTFAYGPVDGPRKYKDEYVPMLALGAAVQHTSEMSNEQQNATLESFKPVPDTPGFDQQQKRYEALVTATNAVRQQRQADPVGFSIQQKVAGVAPLDMTTPEAMAKGMSTRVPQAMAISQLFNTAPQMLSNAEAEGMKRAFVTMPAGHQGDYLLSLRNAINNPQAFKTLVNQIAPDSPETQIAAGILAQTGSVTTVTHLFSKNETVNARETANWILAGRALVNPTASDKKEDGSSKGWSMPKEAEFKQAFNDQVGDAFAGNPKAYLDTYQAVRAYYAGKSSFMGKADSQLAPDTNLIGEAVKGVTGGVASVGGGKVLMPWGMREDEFQKSLTKAAARTFADNGITGNAADPAAYRLLGAGDGQYYMMSGTEALRNPTTGQKVIVDVLQRGKITYPANEPSIQAKTTKATTGQAAHYTMPGGKHQ